jgi:hypothetical protein
MDLARCSSLNWTERSAEPLFEDDRIADPRGLAVDPKENLLFLNTGANRVLAISSDGRVVRYTGQIEGLNPGGGNFGPDGRYFVGLRSARTIIALSTSLDNAIEYVLPRSRRMVPPCCVAVTRMFVLRDGISNVFHALLANRRGGPVPEARNRRPS